MLLLPVLLSSRRDLPLSLPFLLLLPLPLPFSLPFSLLLPLPLSLPFLLLLPLPLPFSLPFSLLLPLPFSLPLPSPSPSPLLLGTPRLQPWVSHPVPKERGFSPWGMLGSTNRVPTPTSGRMHLVFFLPFRRDLLYLCRCSSPPQPINSHTHHPKPANSITS